MCCVFSRTNNNYCHKVIYKRTHGVRLSNNNNNNTNIILTSHNRYWKIDFSEKRTGVIPGIMSCGSYGEVVKIDFSETERRRRRLHRHLHQHERTFRESVRLIILLYCERAQLLNYIIITAIGRMRCSENQSAAPVVGWIIILPLLR